MKQQTKAGSPKKAESSATKRALPEVVITFDEMGEPQIEIANTTVKVETIGELVKYVQSHSWRWGLWRLGSYATIAPHLNLSPRTVENLVAGRKHSLEVWFRAQAWMNRMEAEHLAQKGAL